MAKQLNPGDRVEWNTPQGKTTGKVKKKLTSSKKIKGHVAEASKENPEYLVQSENPANKPPIGPASCVNTETIKVN
jgi:Hypervirulence associated proteins TUDOR domain